ncbi:MAG TPA: sigma-70 family RNA polymerase sigma factor [Acidimicrobiales bacterium]|nr:sigma-70 family RNA polymerase sigma factor [Acidimicrobiales bacterium]
MGAEQAGADERRESFLALYDGALPEVYGYLSARCGAAALAEELTAETFLAAVDAVRREPPTPVNVAWLIGVARHKLVDHWRAEERRDRRFQLLTTLRPPDEEPWEVELDALRVREVLGELSPQHRAVLSLRYLDDLPVAEVAELLGRTLHATEALLARARAAFRGSYGGSGADDE